MVPGIRGMAENQRSRVPAAVREQRTYTVAVKDLLASLGIPFRPGCVVSAVFEDGELHIAVVREVTSQLVEPGPPL